MPVPTSGALVRTSARLALHVRTHQRAVGVVILEERNERCRDRHQLLRHTSTKSTFSRGTRRTSPYCGQR